MSVNEPAPRDHIQSRFCRTTDSHSLQTFKIVDSQPLELRGCGCDISSSGTLSATAGGTITNALPAGTSGAAPVMQSVHNLELNTSNVLNQGLISSTQGSVRSPGFELRVEFGAFTVHV